MNSLPLLVLDGALGTTLQDDLNCDISSSLWSSLLLRSDPSSLCKTHKLFADAGADIILTATYQASIEGWAKEGVSTDEAETLMRSAVEIAQSATQGSRHKYIALSLGCYGATCSAEYSGDYPHMSTEQLADWHYQRLLVFADQKTLTPLHYIAFETVPLVREGIAIARAMHLFRRHLFTNNLQQFTALPFWISYNFPDGQLPEANGEDRQPSSVISSLASLDEKLYDMPPIIGINCTKPYYLQAILQQWVEAIKQTGTSETLPRKLVLYPDGGQTYDSAERTWKRDAEWDTPSTWAQHLVDLAVQQVRNDGSGCFDEVIVGGCCKATVQHIRDLKAAVVGI